MTFPHHTKPHLSMESTLRAVTPEGSMLVRTWAAVRCNLRIWRWMDEEQRAQSREESRWSWEQRAE